MELSKVCQLFLIICCILAPAMSRDLTRVASASGEPVVRAVVRSSRAVDSGSVSLDQRQAIEQFLREFAYVESRDGTITTADTASGGIWRINSTIFDQTKQYVMNNLVQNDNIHRVYGVRWSSIEYQELDIPLYSGLAARLYLLQLHPTTPLTSADSDAVKARYWATHFRGGELHVLGIWTNRVNQLRQIETCNVDTDVVFVLDSSGSIGTANYQRVRDYAYNFTQSLLSSTNTNSRVGVILYGNNASIVIPFNSNVAEALEDIENLPFWSEATNTPEGLCLLTRMPWREEISVLRIAVVLTDGESNRMSGVCPDSDGNPGTVNSTAYAVRALVPPVLVFAVGVGGNYDVTELMSIATRPSLVDGLNSFDYTVLRQNILFRSYFICFEETQDAEVGERRIGTSNSGQRTGVNIQFQNPEGVTFRICIDQGDIVVYISYENPNPNSAQYDDSVELSHDGVSPCITYYVPSQDGMMIDNNRRKRQTDGNGIETTTIYITIVGVSETESHFSINSSYGNVTLDLNECAQDSNLCGETAERCHNTDGSYYCECSQGYEGRHICEDIDECAITPELCGENGQCNNTDGSYRCDCYEGYEENDKICTVAGRIDPLLLLILVFVVLLLVVISAVGGVIFLFHKAINIYMSKVLLKPTH